MIKSILKIFSCIYMSCILMIDLVFLMSKQFNPLIIETIYNFYSIIYRSIIRNNNFIIIIELKQYTV